MKARAERFPHEELLASVSRSFFLSIKFLPEKMRQPIATGYLLARLSDTIADSGDIPLQRRLESLEKLQTGSSEVDFTDFAKTVEHAGEKVLLESAPEILELPDLLNDKNREAVRKVLATIISGQTWDLTHFSNETPSVTETELLDYTYSVAGCVGEFWTEVGFLNLGGKFAKESDRDSMMNEGRQLGQGLQLINIIRDLHEDLPAGRSYLPGEDVDHWLGVCRCSLNEGKKYVSKVRHRRVRFATALPLYLAEATATKLEQASAEEIRKKKIKVPRSTVWKMAVKAALFS